MGVICAQGHELGFGPRVNVCGPENYWVSVTQHLANQARVNYLFDPQSVLDHLDSYLRGNYQAMSLVAVPSPQQEQQRSIVCYREQLMRNRRRAEARGRALPLTQGILAPVGWWRPAAWEQFKAQLPEWMFPNWPTGKSMRGPLRAKNARCADT